ncbi:MAG: serpin family protein [Phycisphaerales bacterium]|nr:MAG: serpin family protein [Phycisphaerales bacterium]
MRMKCRQLGVSILTILSAGSIVGSAAEVNPPTGEQAATQKAADSMVSKTVAGNARFAFDLYDQLRGQSDGNLFCSPHSISAALAMTYAGARTETAEQMARTLHFGLPQDRLPAGFRELAARLEKRDEDEEPAHVELAIANRLWSQTGEKFLDDFLDTVRINYGGGFETVDYRGDLEGARQTINDWVAQRTREKIRDLLQRGDITPLTVLVLTNAIYFKGDWLTQFDPKKTRDLPFHIAADKAVKTPMMSLKSNFGLYESKDLQMLEMPYDGERLSMLILLPTARDGLPRLEEVLSMNRLEGWLKESNVRETQVLLPRFRMTSRFDLGETLAALGMPLAFTGWADFSGMNGKRDLFISKVIHQAFVQVDEQGTEAAAATAVGIMRTSVTRPPTFLADHPFLFVIRDRETGAILFLGRVMDPTAGGG